MTPATKFRMASHSKLFTSTAIMQLRDQGKVRLDDPVSKYLPWFKVKGAQVDDPPITIEELLTHSSGLSREAGSHWSDYKFPDASEVRAYVEQNSAVYSAGALEVLESCTDHCRHDRGGRLRRDLLDLCAEAYL